MRRIGKNKYYYAGWVISRTEYGYYVLIRKGIEWVFTPIMSVQAAVESIDNLNSIP